MKKQSKIVFEYLGKDELLESRALKDFVKFMSQRLPYEQDTGYIREWARRFKSDNEWFHADAHSRRILFKINPSRYKQFLKGFPIGRDTSKKISRILLK
jgi:hypothetical protein